MDNLKLYEINASYITYLSAYAPHLFQNKKSGQKNERKYIGIVFHINGFDYFAPLSSFKDKHRLMKEGLDFIKIKDGESSSLAKRCNDFLLLEKACKNYR